MPGLVRPAANRVEDPRVPRRGSGGSIGTRHRRIAVAPREIEWDHGATGEILEDFGGDFGQPLRAERSQGSTAGRPPLTPSACLRPPPSTGAILVVAGGRSDAADLLDFRDRDDQRPVGTATTPVDGADEMSAAEAVCKNAGGVP